MGEIYFLILRGDHDTVAAVWIPQPVCLLKIHLF